MPSLTVENYVKTIYQLCTQQGGKPAATGQIAQELDVSPGSVSSMLKTLGEGKLVTHTPYEGVRLTRAGLALALRVVRRHRLIELFLAKTLDMNWDEIHEEAEHMEHAVSDHLIDRIDTFLGHPDADPHGDPIPRADGSMATEQTQTLANCGAGIRFRLSRVLDQSPEFLRYLSEVGLEVGASGRVVAVREAAGVVTIAIGKSETTLARDAADQILVTAD